MSKGKIIILNGVSSSGKTTLSKALQNALIEPYIVLSIDNFISMMPERLIENDLGNTVYKSQSILHQTIKLLSDMGMNVIVDNVMLSYFRTLNECVDLLHDYPVLLVHVKCPLHELRRREQERGDRNIGQGEEQLDDLRPQDLYDITVDTFAQTTEDCVNAITEMLSSPNRLSAIKQLWLHKDKL